MSKQRLKLRGRIRASWSGPVKITRADGSVEVQPAISPRSTAYLADADEGSKEERRWMANEVHRKALSETLRSGRKKGGDRT